ncbi:type II toxin-antitoxin system VapC family toxin [Brevundimonas sp. NPDC092305]|uniref:type II toxin-antitoxin system VapC family toxin n=1 Tax=Brevundimonas sp. NPDC092305 TaxID=3363957 RepID=UPI0037FBC026
MTPSKLLLDTHALIWLVEGVELSKSVQDAIVFAALADGVFVSPVSAWEIGMLCAPRPSRAPLVLKPDPKAWYAMALSAPGLTETPFTATAAMDSRTLPGELHGDPADRLLIATAREIGAALVTRDNKILDYARAGHVQALAC